MSSNSPKMPKRKSPRLPGYDYSQGGAYFVTICTQGRLCLFGDVVDGEMQLNEAGHAMDAWWPRVSERFAPITLDQHIIMPNHTHAILLNDDPGISLSRVVGWYKTMTTNAYIRGVRTAGWPRFPGKLCQSRFHDHIIRNEKRLHQIREYVIFNAARWKKDVYWT